MTPRYRDATLPIDERVEDLLPRLTLREKIGQLCQINADIGAAEIRERARLGLLGSRITVNSGAGGDAERVVAVEESNAVQRVAVEESRLGIPVLNGRDVIHGHTTIFPIPLAQAASWDLELVAEAAAHAAREAAAHGIHWTFAPMLDIARDPRWGRVIEGCGEDPWLAGRMGAAMVSGFQGDDPREPGKLLACAKHFVAYGTSEGGRDYASGECSDHTLRNVYLEPFRQAVEAGCATVMAGFHDLNGEPMTASRYLLTDLLRSELGFTGFVVSDWASVDELITHGVAEGPREAAELALRAGVDMEMVTSCFADHLESSIASGRLEISALDEAVRRVLRAKFRKGLFENPYVDPSLAPRAVRTAEARACARRLAVESCVLLKNEGALLPLPKTGKRIAVLGPLVSSRRELLGNWVMDGVASDVTTILDAIREVAPRAELTTANLLDAAVLAARQSDIAVVIVGESPERTGEACNISDLALPRDQLATIEALRRTGTPLVIVVCAGRPLPIASVVDAATAVLYAWHPGTEGGRAIAALLFGDESPSGKLPVTLPRAQGQVPIFYNFKNGGRAINGYYPSLPVPVPHRYAYQDELSTPLFPFGFGLSYTRFEYTDVRLDGESIPRDGSVSVGATVTNMGPRRGQEIVQCYLRDFVASVTRPVRELKAFRRVDLGPGESARVELRLGPEELSFWNATGKRVVESGRFGVYVGGSSYAVLGGEFVVI